MTTGTVGETAEPSAALTEDELAMLELEAGWWKYPAANENDPELAPIAAAGLSRRSSAAVK